MQLLARLSVEFGIELPLQAVFDSPTVAGIARAMESVYLSAQAAR
jgi:acyl carrier protein